MANQKISLSMVKGLSDGRVYVDMDVQSKAVEKEIVNKNTIRQSVRNILTFHKGERVLYPEFGNGMYDYIFEGITRQTKNELIKEIHSMLNDEPRIDVDSVDVTSNVDSNELLVTVSYTIPLLSVSDSISISVNGTLV